MKNISQDWFNVGFGTVLIFCIYLLIAGFGSYNQSYITRIDANVHISDKYHKAEDCTWNSDGNGGGYESCDPERFVVIFDNNESIDLKDQESWSQVREGQLWHFYKEQGRLWTIKKEAYKL